MTSEDGGFAERMAKVESLIEKAERFSDPAAREVTREIVAALLELHGAGLARVLELLAADQSAQRAVSSFTSDGLVASMLLLHGLHPVDLESRVRIALDAVRPMLKSHGGGVELLGVEDGIVRIRLEGNCDGCPSSAETLRTAVTTALDEAAPDRVGLEVSGLEPPVVPSRTFSLPMLGEVVVGAAMMGHTTRSFAALKRFAQPPKHAPERCELCGQAIGPEHPHLLELSSRALKCSCHPCSMLFPAGAAVKYRHVPRDGQVLADFALSDSAWERLQTPIGLAFFVHNSSAGHVVGYYPSPAGATVSDLPDAAWNELVAANPMLAELLPDVEALLVYRVRDKREYYRAPIDACYELVGLIRAGWCGLSGGTAVWDSIDRFFAKIKERWHA